MVELLAQLRHGWVFKACQKFGGPDRFGEDGAGFTNIAFSGRHQLQIKGSLGVAEHLARVMGARGSIALESLRRP